MPPVLTDTVPKYLLETPPGSRGWWQGCCTCEDFRTLELAEIFCLWKLARKDCVDYLKNNWTFTKGREVERENS